VVKLIPGCHSITSHLLFFWSRPVDAATGKYVTLLEHDKKLLCPGRGGPKANLHAWFGFYSHLQEPLIGTRDTPLPLLGVGLQGTPLLSAMQTSILAKLPTSPTVLSASHSCPHIPVSFKKLCMS
jgi:hypothetical protein